MHTIVTHPGGAHKDDVLAVCVLVALHGCPIVRREPTPEELDDPLVAVVDIGGVHDPARSNFDHHHFPREHAPTCALSLVLEHLGLYQDALRFCDWLETAEWFDSRGPKKTGAWLGVPRRAISQLNSPIDMTLLRRFAQATRIEPSDPLYGFMRMVGDDLLEYLRVARERLDFIAQRVERWTIACGDDQIEALFLPRAEGATDDLSAMLGSYIRAHRLDQVIHAIVYPDRRGDGFGIGRYEDHPSLDFSRVEGQPDVHFAHKSGFMCKTSASTHARLQELVTIAWSRTP
ncbi:MAG: MYG1 family protein [Deltaproteobacteria bacterium]|nr:MYG1 family protein [Deltaproteobacteria bacterium]